MEFIVLAKHLNLLEASSKRLDKIEIITDLLKKTPLESYEATLLLLEGRVYPVWSDKKLGVAKKIAQRAIGQAYGISEKAIEASFKELGDLGSVAENSCTNKTQNTLAQFGTQQNTLSTEYVFKTLQKIADVDGAQSVSLKISNIIALLNAAQPVEAKYIIRIVLEDLRVGVAQGTLRDSIIRSIFPKILGLYDQKELQEEAEGRVLGLKNIEEAKELPLLEYTAIKCQTYQDARELYNAITKAFQEGYDKLNELYKVAIVAKKSGFIGLRNIPLEIFTPMRVMLMQRVETIHEAIEKIPLPFQLEYKYDGFRCQAHKKGNTVLLFTRNMENVTAQFPEIVSEIQSHVDADEAILDGELVGIDLQTNKYLPFQSISQRIKRKHNIATLVKELPVRYRVWDVVYINKETILERSLQKRREILEKIILPGNITCSDIIHVRSEEKGEAFYKKSLQAGNEGVVVKDLHAHYQPGNRVGCWLKIKPVMDPLDVVILQAQWGEGKRSKWLTSFSVGCRNGDEFLEIGKVSSGLKEKEGEDTSYNEVTELLLPLINTKIPEKNKTVAVQPKIVVQVAYEEIQKSPTYSSGYALRFPRILSLRPDLDRHEVDDLEKIKEYYKRQSI